MNLSYILPFYKKAAAFRMMLPLNECFQQPDVEVVCVLDEPSDEPHVMETVRANPNIKFRVIANDWDHPWRPPCIPYNIGIRHALAAHVILADPESAFVLPRPDFLTQLVREDYRLAHAGICWYESDIRPSDPPDLMRQKILVCEATGSIWLWGYGLLLAPKINLERVFGLDESRRTYALDDNDIRIRLARIGCRCVIDGRIKVFHSAHTDTLRKPAEEFPGPHIALTQQKENWGKAYSRVAHDWKKA